MAGRIPGYIITLNPFNDNKFLQSGFEWSRWNYPCLFTKCWNWFRTFFKFCSYLLILWETAQLSNYPQAPESGSVVTRIQFATDGYIYLLIPGVGYANTGIQTPKGTFDLQMVLDRATFDYSFYINGELIYSGIPAYAGDIEEIVLLSFNEADGPVMNIDNVVLLDGDLGHRIG